MSNHKKYYPNGWQGIVKASNGTKRIMARQSRCQFPKNSARILRSWLYEHRYDAYPEIEEKHALADEANLSISQVEKWFIDARRRALPKILLSEGKDPRDYLLSRRRYKDLTFKECSDSSNDTTISQASHSYRLNSKWTKIANSRISLHISPISENSSDMAEIVDKDYIDAEAVVEYDDANLYWNDDDSIPGFAFCHALNEDGYITNEADYSMEKFHDLHMLADVAVARIRSERGGLQNAANM